MERMWYTLVDSSRAMLTHAQLPLSYWAHAMRVAAWVHNRVVGARRPVSPFQALTGKAPDLSSARVFGCPAYVHVDKSQRRQFDEKGRKGVMVGYSSNSAGWLVYFPDTGSVVTTRSVAFDERWVPSIPGSSSRGGDSGVLEDQEFWSMLLPEHHEIDHQQQSEQQDEEQPEVEPEQPEVQPEQPACEHVGVEEVLESQEDYHHVGAADVDVLSSGGSPRNDDDDEPPNDEGDNSHEDTEVAGGSLQVVRSRPVRECTQREPYAYWIGDGRQQDPDPPVSTFTACSQQLVPAEDVTPRTYKEAVTGPAATEWTASIQDEYNSLLVMGVRGKCAVPLPPGRNALGCKWVFRIKRGPQGEITKYKSRLVIQGFLQQEGVDYTEVFAPVVHFVSLRTVLSMAVALDMEIQQADVDVAFLNADLKEDVYMRCPEGFPEFDTAGVQLVWKLEKALYGLKQAPREWFTLLSQWVLERGMTQSAADPCVFVQMEGRQLKGAICVYVDDCIIISHKNCAWGQQFKKDLGTRFQIKDLGAAEWILGMALHRDRAAGTLLLHQRQYILDMLDKLRVVS